MKVSLPVQAFLWVYLFPYFKSFKVLTGTKCNLCLSSDVQQQSDGTFEDTLLNVHCIDGMASNELFLVR
jgi:hypothetical protein